MHRENSVSNRSQGIAHYKMPRRRRQPERQKKQRLDKAKQTTTRFFVHLLTARVPLEYALFHVLWRT